MNRKHLQWLWRELPTLVSAGVVPADVAERIRQHYGGPTAGDATAKRWAIILFGILGASLIGGGIILLLAHNWVKLSRPARAGIAVLPLLLSQALGAWLLWSGRTSTAWREGVGMFQTLAIGAAVSLVGQTYNVGGRFDEFMLTWCLLALPLAYLMIRELSRLWQSVELTVEEAMNELSTLCLTDLEIGDQRMMGRIADPRPVVRKLLRLAKVELPKAVVSRG